MKKEEKRKNLNSNKSMIMFVISIILLIPCFVFCLILPNDIGSILIDATSFGQILAIFLLLSLLLSVAFAILAIFMGNKSKRIFVIIASAIIILISFYPVTISTISIGEKISFIKTGIEYNENYDIQNTYYARVYYKHKDKIKDQITIESYYKNKPVIRVGYFNNIEQLKKVIISEGIKTINSEAFRECINLKEILIATTVEEIGFRAFYNCSSLQTIILYTQLKVIHFEAFSGSKLKTIIFKGTKQQWRNITKNQNDNSSWHKGLEDLTIQCLDGILNQYDEEL